MHAASGDTYGSRRVHAELTLGRGIVVGYHAIELLMRRAGLHGVTGAPKYRRGLRPEATATDLVTRQFARADRDQLWVTDIERHEALLHRAAMKGRRLRALAGVW